MNVYDKDGNPKSIAFNKSGTRCAVVFDVNGNTIPLEGESYDYSDYVVTEDFSISTSSYLASGTQGMAAYGQTLFQFQTDGSTIENVASVIDLDTKSFVGNITAQAKHGNAAQFTNEFYDGTDEFPLIMVSSYDTSENLIYLNRIDKTSSTLVKTYKLPIENAGYRVNAVPSKDEPHIMWSVGHGKNSTTDATDNWLIIARWNLSNETDNGDGTVTPMFVDSFVTPFIYAIQDTKFFDHKLFVSSGYPSTTQYLTLIDPYTQAVKETVTLNGTDETEGIEFVADGNGGFYMLLNTIHTGKYYKYVFASA